MRKEPVVATLSALRLRSHGVFRGRDAVTAGVTRNQLTRVETNGRRGHHDPADDEDDRRSAASRDAFGYRLVFATWDEVTPRPNELLRELTAPRGLTPATIAEQKLEKRWRVASKTSYSTRTAEDLTTRQM
jgi:hypothetical protein